MSLEIAFSDVRKSNPSLKKPIPDIEKPVGSLKIDFFDVRKSISSLKTPIRGVETPV